MRKIVALFTTLVVVLIATTAFADLVPPEPKSFLIPAVYLP